MARRFDTLIEQGRHNCARRWRPEVQRAEEGGTKFPWGNFAHDGERLEVRSGCDRTVAANLRRPQ